MIRLFKDATHYTSGMHIKDLDHINRDLKNVIVVDWNKDTTLVSTNTIFAISACPEDQLKPFKFLKISNF